MKTKRFVILSLAWLAGAAGWAGAYDGTTKKPANRVEVVFFEPEKFTDATDVAFGGEKSRDAVLDQLKSHLQQRAQQYLGEGQRLVITVTDVDLAGEFEPWHGGRLQDVRIVKEIYPPHVKLSFKLVNANGETEKSGERDLRDMTFQLTATLASANDPLRYEKAMLDEWLRTEFQRSKKT